MDTANKPGRCCHEMGTLHTLLISNGPCTRRRIVLFFVEDIVSLRTGEGIERHNSYPLTV